MLSGFNSLAVWTYEVSVWNFLILSALASILGLWTYSTYLEFDATFVVFALKLVTFLTAVWLALNSGSTFLLLLAWEIIGLISFNLISTWAHRSWTLASSFSAIGFNRIGDVFLLHVVISVAFVLDSHMNLANGLLIFAMLLKSVNFVTYLWLPEAMEGPTPVSSLLHSATLVMAGIFVVYATGCRMSTPVLVSFLVSLVLVCLLARSELDLKRIVAFSTVVMVSALWLLLSVSLNASTVVVCLIHAAYKSGTFLSIGRILTKVSTYHDGLGLPTASKTTFAVIALFLVGMKTSQYAGSKHAVDAVQVHANVDVTILTVFAIGLIVLWLAALRLTNARKLPMGPNPNDPMVLSMIFSIVLFQFWLVSTSTLSAAGVGSLLAVLGIRFGVRNLPNFGSVGCSTSVFTAAISRYPGISSLLPSLATAMTHKNVTAVGMILAALVV